MSKATPLRKALRSGGFFFGGFAAAALLLGGASDSRRRELDPDAIERTRGEVGGAADGPAAARPPPAVPPVLAVHDRQAAARAALRWTVSLRAGEYYGSGVLVDRRGYILTSAHLVEGLDEARVTFMDGFSAPSRVIDRDDDMDLALLRADVGDRLAAPLGTAADTSVGEDILAVGSPRKLHFTVSRGMVSFAGRPFNGVRYLQTDIPINVGNSGGPVVNMKGEVIAIMAFILRDSQGLSFAVPIDYALGRFQEELGPTTHDSAHLLQAWAVPTTERGG